MQRCSEINGKSIMSSDAGEEIGTVSDLLIDESGERIVALVVGGRLFRSDRVVPYDQVQVLGRDAVIVKSPAGLDAREWQARKVPGSRSSRLTGRPILTRSGRNVGSLADLYVDETSGAVVGYDVERRAAGGLLRNRSMLRRSSDITIGPDAVLIGDEDAARLEADRSAETKRSA